jgi:hypothetical protein
MAKDSLAVWRRPGSKPVEVKESGGVPVVALSSGIRPREYKAYVSESARVPMLLLKRGLVKKPEADIALSYGYLNKVVSDGYGFVFSMSFARPHPWGPVVVEVRGEGMAPLVDGILSGSVKSIQIFDPDRFFPPKEGEFDAEGDEWRGIPVVKDITITDQTSPAENTTKH